MPASGEIVKQAVIDCAGKKVCFYWWPKLPALEGWHSDQHVNLTQGGENGFNVLIPDGSTFGDAPAIIYAKAVYRERYDEEHHAKSTLDSFIQDDKTDFQEHGKDTKVAGTAALKTADGQVLKTFTYFRPAAKTWECVAYGTEDDQYLTFVIAARSLASYRNTLPIFQKLISQYRR
jgi:hypothetical protein